MADAPETVTEAVQLLTAAGYEGDFDVRDLAAVCAGCHSAAEIEHGVVERQFRFEGPSDPADEAIVLGVRCPTCGARGVIVSAFGPDADPELFAALGRLARSGDGT